MKRTVNLSEAHADALDRVEEITGIFRYRLVAWLLDKVLVNGPEGLAAAVTADGKGAGALKFGELDLSTMGATAIFGRPMETGEVAP